MGKIINVTVVSGDLKYWRWISINGNTTLTVVDSTDLENETTGFEGGSVEGNVIPMFADSSTELIAA